jgi:hypothetical protein
MRNAQKGALSLMVTVIAKSGGLRNEPHTGLLLGQFSKLLQADNTRQQPGDGLLTFSHQSKSPSAWLGLSYVLSQVAN